MAAVTSTVHCPHCKDDIRTNNAKHHARTCIYSPAVLARMRAALAVECPDRVLSITVYKGLARANGWMSETTIAVRMPWPEFVVHLGFEPFESPDGDPSARYANSDEFRQALRDMASDLHNGRCGPNMAEWDLYRPDGTWDGRTVAHSHGRVWAHVLRWAALKPGESGYYMRMATIRRLGLADLDAPADNTSGRERWRDSWPLTFIRRKRTYFDWTRHVYVAGIGLEFK